MELIFVTDYHLLRSTLNMNRVLQAKEDLFGVKLSAADVYHIKQDYDAFPGRCVRI